MIRVLSVSRPDLGYQANNHIKSNPRNRIDRGMDSAGVRATFIAEGAPYSPGN